MVPLGYLSIVCPWSGGNASTGQSVSPLTAFLGFPGLSLRALTIRPQAAQLDDQGAPITRRNQGARNNNVISSPRHSTTSHPLTQASTYRRQHDCNGTSPD
jgi:hypothetical protein